MLLNFKKNTVSLYTFLKRSFNAILMFIKILIFSFKVIKKIQKPK